MRSILTGITTDMDSTAGSEYSQFVFSGIGQGKRSDLTGGGLLRSHGGWTGVKALRETGEYQKGDERILGDGAFVKDVLEKAEEKFKEKYWLKAKGYDLDKLITRARSILCYWATEKLGTSQSQLAQMLRRSQLLITYAVRRGKVIVDKNSYTIG